MNIALHFLVCSEKLVLCPDSIPLSEKVSSKIILSVSDGPFEKFGGGGGGILKLHEISIDEFFCAKL